MNPGLKAVVLGSSAAAAQRRLRLSGGCSGCGSAAAAAVAAAAQTLRSSARLRPLQWAAAAPAPAALVHAPARRLLVSSASRATPTLVKRYSTNSSIISCFAHVRLEHRGASVELRRCVGQEVRAGTLGRPGLRTVRTRRGRDAQRVERSRRAGGTARGPHEQQRVGQEEKLRGLLGLRVAGRLRAPHNQGEADGRERRAQWQGLRAG